MRWRCGFDFDDAGRTDLRLPARRSRRRRLGRACRVPLVGATSNCDGQAVSVPLRSGSRCRCGSAGRATQAKCLNERVGRCVVPIGRHSLMNGVTVRSVAPEDIRSFAGQLSTLFGATAAIDRWSRTVVRENLVAAGLPPDVDVDVSSYLASVRGVVSSDQRFVEMVAALGGRLSQAADNMGS